MIHVYRKYVVKGADGQQKLKSTSLSKQPLCNVLHHNAQNEEGWGGAQWVRGLGAQWVIHDGQCQIIQL